MIIKKTRQEILKEMLDRVPSDYDREEGGLFYDNLAPVAIEIEDERELQAFIFKNSFVETATGIYLDYKVGEQGITRKPATKSVGVVTITGEIGAVVPKGTQVATDSYLYITTEEGIIGAEGVINLEIEAQAAGSTYNVPAGAIDKLPITIKGLQKVTNKFATVDGFDAEEDEPLRARYFFKVRNPITSGNEYHYKKWCNEVEGVGGTKVQSLWQGPGTVKCVIANSEMGVAPEELLDRVKTYVETVRPIGATVTIASAINKDITVTGIVTLATNVNIEVVKAAYEKAVAKHLREIGFEGTYISYARLGNILLNVPGVTDYKDFKVNGGVTNIDLGKEEVPNLIKVDLSEVG